MTTTTNDDLDRFEQQSLTGQVAQFHYNGTCNGLLRWTDDYHPDGRRLAQCDVCGSLCAMRRQATESTYSLPLGG